MGQYEAAHPGARIAGDHADRLVATIDAEPRACDVEIDGVQP